MKLKEQKEETISELKNNSIEEFYSKKVKKNKLNNIVILSIIVLLSIIGIAVCLYSNSEEIISLINKNNKVELLHTQTTGQKSEGVYVTDVSDVVEETMPSIVSITSKTLIKLGNFGPSFFGNNNQYVEGEGAGSGVIISESDDAIYILTNNHVIENSSELTVQFIDDSSSDASIVGISERNDIAVISVKKSNLKKETLESIKIATIGDSDNLKVGNGIIAIGNALGYGQSVTTGVVSAIGRDVTTDSYTIEMIQIDAAINGGNSGGALLNSSGEVVGINTAKYSSSGSSSEASIEGMGFAIPISDVKDIIEKLLSGNNDTNGASLGIEGYMTNSSNMSGYNMPTGFYISKITSNSTAEKANLEIGNIITEIDGISITKIEDLKKVLQKKEKGDKSVLTIRYVKGKEYLEKKVDVIFQ